MYSSVNISDLLAMGALDGVSRAWESEESEMSAGEETTRRGSLPTMSTTRRGSRLQDILRYNQVSNNNKTRMTTLIGIR